MKLRYNIAAWCLAAGVLSLAGCNDDNDAWEPGPQAEIAYQVYFTSGNPVTEELTLGAKEEYTLTLSRENDAEALTLQFVLTNESGKFTIPDKVEFQAGEKDAEITVRFDGSDEVGIYQCSIGIPEGVYNSPYTSRIAAIDISQRVSNWHLYISNVKITDYYKDIFGDSNSYSVEMDRDGDLDRYRLRGFMDNYDLVFRLSEEEGGEKEEVPGDSDYYYIYPENGSYGIDEDGYDVWYFDTQNGESSFPLYHSQLAGYLDWSCIYAPDPYTEISFKDRYGLICGCFYLISDDGNESWTYPYFTITWKSSDVQD